MSGQAIARPDFSLGHTDFVTFLHRVLCSGIGSPILEEEPT